MSLVVMLGSTLEHCLLDGAETMELLDLMVKLRLLFGRGCISLDSSTR